MSVFLALLQVLLIGLKLMGVIAWSWWLVLLPVIITFCFWVVIFSFPAVLILLSRKKR